jgi:hypothetical protein
MNKEFFGRLERKGLTSFILCEMMKVFLLEIVNFSAGIATELLEMRVVWQAAPTKSEAR